MVDPGQSPKALPKSAIGSRTDAAPWTWIIGQAGGSVRVKPRRKSLMLAVSKIGQWPTLSKASGMNQ
ncbi:hypothetical protein BCAR13_410064 [Paraburkholderia caribensis]|nr:hypothetical protein BCAR13_410064 [Paraburkholderia caribensis]